MPAASENYITLCTHNYKADAVNAAALAKLSGPVHRFRGSVEGDFSEKSLPTEMELQLKEGAQVIFIKNDSDPQRRYYNGKIAVVKSIEEDEISVEFPDGGGELQLDRETWRNIRYAYDREKETIDEEEIGSFKQFPVRLAWAITIHKSQGLTFKKAIIDAGASFAAGQVYVALSRCTSLEGMMLHSKIQQGSISTDERVIAFASRENEEEELEQLLGMERQRYWGEQLLQTFDFRKVLTALENFVEELPGKKLPDPKASLALGELLLGKAKEKQEVATKFRPELTQLMNNVPVSGTKLLEERASKAIAYFSKFLTEEMLLPVQQHEASLKKATKVKKYSKIVGNVKYAIVTQLEKLREARYGDIIFNPLSSEEKEGIDSLKKATVKKKKKGEKGSSLKETLVMFRSGKGLEEISKHRGLAISTLEGHLALLVKSGELDIHELMEDQRLEVILDALSSTGNTSMTQVKQKLGDGYSYGEIRAVWNYRELTKQDG